jgi:hypothetical protein
LNAWSTFTNQFLETWKNRQRNILAKVVVVSMLSGLYAYLSPDEYRTHVVIYPEDQGGPSSGLNNILGAFPGENKSTGTIRAILASHSLRNACIRDSIHLHGYTKEVKDWLREDQIKRGFILSRLMPPPVDGEGAYTFANRYLSRISIIFTDEDGFISLRLTTADDSLTLALGHLFIRHAQEYHRQRQNLKAGAQAQYLQIRADSINRELDIIQKNIARYGDQKRYTARYSEEVELQDLYRKQEILQQMFVSVSLLKEEAISRNQQSAPLFQVLDPPQKPLDVVRHQVWVYVLGGAFFSGIFFVLWSVKTYILKLISSLI